MPPSVGPIHIRRFDRGLRRWVIGAAPKIAPYWRLDDGTGTPCGRLVLVFEDDEHVRTELGEWLDDSTRTRTGQQPMKMYMVRTLRDLSASFDASVSAVRGERELFVWIRSVVTGQSSAMPPELSGDGSDVFLLPRRLGLPGRPAVVREAALGSVVTCGNPRELSWVS